jgi:hypothetical protein
MLGNEPRAPSDNEAEEEKSKPREEAVAGVRIVESV